MAGSRMEFRIATECAIHQQINLEIFARNTSGRGTCAEVSMKEQLQL
jgi:hypothetical protein